MQVVNAPNQFRHMPRPWVFLAGSIEMGKAEPWQEKIETLMEEYGGTLLNPRRPDWDSSWEQTLEDTNFRTQVEWELAALDAADQILLYFDPKTKSPISLLEMGLHARSGKLIVACPEGFWRRGNVQITGLRYGFPVLPTLEAMISHFKGE